MDYKEPFYGKLRKYILFRKEEYVPLLERNWKMKDNLIIILEVNK